MPVASLPPPYPPVPAPTQWADGPVLTSQLRSQVTEAVLFLANRPSFCGLCTAGSLIGGGGNFTNVGLDTDVYDTWSGHDPLGGNPGRYYCQAPGWYLAEGFAGWSYTGNPLVTFATGLQTILNSGTTVRSGEMLPTSNNQFPGPMVADLFNMTRTGLPGATNVDTVSLQVSQNSGSNIALAAPPGQPAALEPRLAARWVCTGSGTPGLPVPANAPFPVPPAYVTADWLNANITDTVGFLAYPPILRVFPGEPNIITGPQFPAGGLAPLDTVTVDNWGGWSSAQSAYTVPASGVYYCYAQASYGTQASAGQASVGFIVNGNTAQPLWGKCSRGIANSTGTIVAAVRRLRLSAGSAIGMAVGLSAGFSMQLEGDGSTRLILVWESA